MLARGDRARAGKYGDVSERLVVAVPLVARSAAGPSSEPATATSSDAVPGDPTLVAELVGHQLFASGASAVAQVDLEGEPHLVADLPADVVAGLRLPHRVLEPERSWTDGWREHAQVWTAGRFVVRPPWLGAGELPDGAVEVVVDPGDAFGSGSHPSTRGCLVALDRLLRPGARVLDVGCGSGVLGVAALLAGASEAVAVDVDPAAVATTEAVARDNRVADRIHVSATPLGEVEGSFDLVLANLLIPIVEELADDLVRVVDRGGRLVLGGLLGRHLPRAREALAGLSVEAAWSEAGGDWWVLVLSRDD